MDDIIYYFYKHGFTFVLLLAVIKTVLIFIYRGFDLAYLFENFLQVYSDNGLEPNEKRKRFRLIHNVLTIAFYVVLVTWLAITFVVRNLN